VTSLAFRRQQVLLFFILGFVLLGLQWVYAQEAFTIVNESPEDGATGVSVTSVVTVTFNESVNASTVDNSTFTVKTGNISIPGALTLSIDGKTATFDATPDLSPNTRYVATIDAAVKDLSGSLLANNQSWSFTTGSESPTYTIQGFADPNLILYFIFIVAAAMVIPLVIDMFLANFRLRQTTGDRGSRIPVGMEGLYRTLMTFGIILLLGMVIFYVLWLLTQNIRNEASQPLLNILQNLSTILGTALATIIAFYFGMRGSAVSAEKATELAQQKSKQQEQQQKQQQQQKEEQQTGLIKGPAGAGAQQKEEQQTGLIKGLAGAGAKLIKGLAGAGAQQKEEQQTGLIKGPAGAGAQQKEEQQTGLIKGPAGAGAQQKEEQQTGLIKGPAGAGAQQKEEQPPV
jgi:Bacterial Ig-like domain